MAEDTPIGVPLIVTVFWLPSNVELIPFGNPVTFTLDASPPSCKMIGDKGDPRQTD